MSAGLFIVTIPTHLKQDLVGWIPCYLHRRRTVEDIVSNESSKCFLQPGNCEDLLRESGLTGWDYTIAGEREGWQKSRWSLLLFFFLPWVSFLPQTGIKYFYLFWARNCFCCSLVVPCPWYYHQRHTTRKQRDIDRWAKNLHRYGNHICTIVPIWEQTLSWIPRVSTILQLCIFAEFLLQLCCILSGQRCIRYRGRKSHSDGRLYFG